MSHQGQKLQRRTTANHITRTDEISIERYEGIIPHPEHLRQLKEIDPEYAKQVMGWTDMQIKHRVKQENRVFRFRFLPIILHNIFAIFSLCILCGVGIFFMMNGYATAGASIICTTVGGVVGIFIVRTHQKNIEKPNPK